MAEMFCYMLMLKQYLCHINFNYYITACCVKSVDAGQWLNWFDCKIYRQFYDDCRPISSALSMTVALGFKNGSLAVRCQ